MRRFRLVLALLAVALLGAMLPSTAVAELAEAKIRATVVNAETGEPVSGVYFAIYRYDETRSVWTLAMNWVLDGAGHLEGSAFAGGTSHYALLYIDGQSGYFSEYYDGVRPTSAGPNLGSVYDWTIDSPNVGDLRNATKIRIAPGGWLTPRPMPYGAVQGRLTDSFTKAGIPGASVYAMRYDETSKTWERAGHSDTVDDNGAYRVVGTADSPITGRIKLDFYLQFTGNVSDLYWPGVRDLAQARELVIQPNQTLYGVDQEVFTPGRLGGRVIEAAGKQAVPGAVARVYWYLADLRVWDHVYGGVAGSGGKWYAPYWWGIRPGAYRIGVVGGGHPETFYGQTYDVDNARSVEVTAGQLILDLDIVLSNKPAISGVVKDATGTVVPDVRVTGLRRDSEGTWRWAGSDTTDDAGRYVIAAPSSGSYTVSFTDRAGTSKVTDDFHLYYGGVEDVAQARTFWVSPNRATVLDDFDITLVSDARARRVAGGSSVSMAVVASRASYASGEVTTAVIASTAAPYDALSASGLAGALDAPILFTNSASLPKSTLTELDRLGVKKVYLVGGWKAITKSQAALLGSLGFTVARLGGADRYATSALVAKELVRLKAVNAWTPVFLVKGTAPGGAVAVASAAYARKSPVLLIGPTSTPSSVSSAIKSLGLKKGYIVGSSTVLPYSALAGARYAGMSTPRLSGGTADYDVAAQFATAARGRGWITPGAVGLLYSPDPQTSLVGGAATGRKGGMLLVGSRTWLPSSTATVLSANSAAISRIDVFAPTSRVGSSVLVSAGSK